MSMVIPARRTEPDHSTTARTSPAAGGTVPPRGGTDQPCRDTGSSCPPRGAASPCSARGPARPCRSVGFRRVRRVRRVRRIHARRSGPSSGAPPPSSFHTKDALLRFRPGMFIPGSRLSVILTPLTTAVTGLAVLGGLAVQPGAVAPRMAAVGNDYDWYDETAAEELRQDQCLMADVLRVGGPAMAAVAQGGLDLPPEGLHTAANRKYWETTCSPRRSRRTRPPPTRSWRTSTPSGRAGRSPCTG